MFHVYTGQMSAQMYQIQCKQMSYFTFTITIKLRYGIFSNSKKTKKQKQIKLILCEIRIDRHEEWSCLWNVTR